MGVREKVRRWCAEEGTEERILSMFSVRNRMAGSKTKMVVDWTEARKRITMPPNKVDLGAGGQLVLRPVEHGDAESVCELIVQLGYDRGVTEVRQWITRLVNRPDTQAAFVACWGEAIVGWIEASVEMRLQSPPFTLIGGLVVKDGVRGGGIGRRLCEEVERWSGDKGVEMVRVTSRSSREEAHRFYLRDGYRHTKTSLVFEKKLHG
jgi:GNAT superfamily N-acetyltransferase